MKPFNDPLVILGQNLFFDNRKGGSDIRARPAIIHHLAQATAANVYCVGGAGFGPDEQLKLRP